MAVFKSLLCIVVLMTVLVAATNFMPYRPGYGLGSFVPVDVIEGMKREAAARSELLLTTNLDNDIQAIAHELKLAADPDPVAQLQNLPSPFSDDEFNSAMDELTRTRGRVWKRKLSALKTLIGQVDMQLDILDKAAAGTGSANGAFTTFASGVESAVNWLTSSYGSREIAFDSLNIDVHYFENRDTSDHRSSNTHAQQVARALSNLTTGVVGTVTTVQMEASKRAKEQIEMFAGDNNIAGTLLLTSFATHRNVLQFDRLMINPDKLQRAWNFLMPNDTVADPLNQRATFGDQMTNESRRVLNATTPSIHLVSEVWKGSALVGMVHFVKTNKSSLKDLQTELRNGSSFNFKNKTTVRSGDMMDGDNATLSKAMFAAEKAVKLASEAKFKVDFSLISVGYIPVLNAQNLEMTVKQLRNFDPGSWTVPSTVDPANQAQGLEAVRSNMATVVKSTVEAVEASDTKAAAVLDVVTFMNAFQDFAKAAQSGGSDNKQTGTAIGAPVGFNVRQFTKLDVLSGLANKYLGTGITLATDQSDDAPPPNATTPTPAPPPA